MKIREEQKTLAEERERARGDPRQQGEAEKLSCARDPRPMPTSTATSGARKSSSATRPRRSTRPSLIPNEPVTVVLSTGGWVRSAKGHDVDAGALSYKSGDAFQALARGRSRSRRCSSTAPGAPIRCRRTLCPARAATASRSRGGSIRRTARKFAGVMIGEPEDLWLLASDAGYGFTVRLKDLHSRDRGRQDGAERSPENALVLAARAGAVGRTRWWRAGQLRRPAAGSSR